MRLSAHEKSLLSDFVGVRLTKKQYEYILRKPISEKIYKKIISKRFKPPEDEIDKRKKVKYMPIDKDYNLNKLFYEKLRYTIKKICDKKFDKFNLHVKMYKIIGVWYDIVDAISDLITKMTKG